LLIGTIFAATCCPFMARDIDAPADDLRDEAERAKRAAKATADPKTKKRLKKFAEEDQAQAIDIENDLA
jgi:anti-sigma factor RsiW